MYYVVIVFALVIAAIIVAKKPQRPDSYIEAIGQYGIVTLAASILLPRQRLFGVIDYLCQALFFGGPILFTILVYYARPHLKAFTAIFAAAVVTLLVVAIDAFYIEPHWLAIRHETLPTSKIPPGSRFRVVVLTDIQTDEPGDYERRVFAEANAQKPDLILFPGDYIQAYHDKYPAKAKILNKIISDANIADAKLNPNFKGAYAVGGDVDEPEPTWPQAIFAGTPVKTMSSSQTIDLAKPDITLTGLTLDDSRFRRYKIPKSDKFHIAFGHAPDFSLEDPPADLLIAGHTHGGQVQLPFFGPILTLSQVERMACGGCFVKNPTGKSDSTLLISRGIGLERLDAPRLRFFCRPEMVVVDIVGISLKTP
ncbi:MAG: metallophosphoesterase [Candidatus Melainabacteria bacterium]|jgi:predicted MPP superfamily phosphohydrolase|nr:metallophosphoesterase [Candidatus Melainabacteria bacterium]MBX9671944.1 hypothetical protein [Candidatus Obscuribacterales bacterium]